jgi:hypothetical protein
MTRCGPRCKAPARNVVERSRPALETIGDLMRVIEADSFNFNNGDPASKPPQVEPTALFILVASELA